MRRAVDGELLTCVTRPSDGDVPARTRRATFADVARSIADMGALLRVGHATATHGFEE